MSNDIVNAAVVGVGIWGQNHALVYNDYHRSQLACICDLNADRAEEIADRYGCR
jgi:predicted dehydrogenase